MKKHRPTPLHTIRLNRFLSMCGVTSRRKADDLITLGKVQVNGTTVRDLGTKVHSDRDKVFVGGKQAALTHEFVYLVMNKPKDTITTMSDERSRRTVMDLLHAKQRVFPIGRLDRNTTGVLLFTNDGEFAHQLTHPRFGVPKAYRVVCDPPLIQKHARKLKDGVTLDDGVARASEVVIIPGAKRKEVGIVIQEGRNRQVHRMFSALGYAVEKLDRVAYGPVTKDGIPRGGTRPLTKHEVRSLRDLASPPERQ